MRFIFLCFILIWAMPSLAQPKRGQRAPAQQEDYRFSPPPPPPLDPPEYDELEDEEFDDGFQPPPPPPVAPVPGGMMNNNLPPQGQSPPSPPPDFRSTNNSYMSAGPGKFRFQVVDGEFYKKGKKRGRGKRLVGKSGN